MPSRIVLAACFSAVIFMAWPATAQARPAPFGHASTTPDHDGAAVALVGFLDDEPVVFDERQQRFVETERTEFSAGLAAEPLQRSGLLHATDAIGQGSNRMAAVTISYHARFELCLQEYSQPALTGG